jgi:ABC-type glycerol-3-phosphate transport system substrate-binding protein
MKTMSRVLVLLSGVALGAAGLSGTAMAQAGQSTPKSWNYEIKDGKRVPKSNRIANADGSWREETRQGKCVTVKERTPNGEYKEVRRCD